MPQAVQDTNRLLNDATVQVVGATDAGLRQALFGVMHEFFTRTNSWQENINISIVANSKGPYRLVIAEGGEFHQLLALVNTKSSAQPAVADMSGNITLRDTPNSADTWTAQIAKTIGTPIDRDGKPQFPDWVIARFYPCVLAGLMGNMFMQPKKPYTNPTMGAYELKKFRNLLGEVKSAVIHGNLYSANTWRYPTAFATRSQRSGSGGTDNSFGSD